MRSSADSANTCLCRLCGNPCRFGKVAGPPGSKEEKTEASWDQRFGLGKNLNSSESQILKSRNLLDQAAPAVFNFPAQIQGKPSEPGRSEFISNCFNKEKWFQSKSEEEKKKSQLGIKCDCPTKHWPDPIAGIASP